MQVKFHFSPHEVFSGLESLDGLYVYGTWLSFHIICYNGNFHYENLFDKVENDFFGKVYVK